MNRREFLTTMLNNAKANLTPEEIQVAERKINRYAPSVAELSESKTIKAKKVTKTIKATATKKVTNSEPKTTKKQATAAENEKLKKRIMTELPKNVTYTAKEIGRKFNITPQKSAALIRGLVSAGANITVLENFQSNGKACKGYCINE